MEACGPGQHYLDLLSTTSKEGHFLPREVALPQFVLTPPDFLFTLHLFISPKLAGSENETETAKEIETKRISSGNKAIAKRKAEQTPSHPIQSRKPGQTEVNLLLDATDYARAERVSYMCHVRAQGEKAGSFALWITLPIFTQPFLLFCGAIKFPNIAIQLTHAYRYICICHYTIM